VPQDKRWLVTSEGAFSYLTRDYGWREAYLWPINADEQGTPQQVRRLIDLVRKNKIPAVFSESTISDKPARQVARETGATYGGVLYVDSLSAAERAGADLSPSCSKSPSDTIAKGFASEHACGGLIPQGKRDARRSSVEGVTVRYTATASPRCTTPPSRSGRHDLRARRHQRLRQIDACSRP
jgi:hypothetical protein